MYLANPDAPNPTTTPNPTNQGGLPNELGQLALTAGIPYLGQVAGEFALSGHRVKKQKELMEWARNKDIDFWKMQNAYNHPMLQRKRLEQAGINPMAAYSKGSVQNTASGNVKSGIPKYELNINAIESMMAMQNLKNLRAQEENIKADTTVKNADANVKGSQLESMDAQRQVMFADVALKKLGYEKGIKMLPLEVQHKINDVIKSGQDVDKNRIIMDSLLLGMDKTRQDMLLQAERIIEAQTSNELWEKHNLHKNDNVVLRILLSKMTPEQLGNWINDSKENIEKKLDELLSITQSAYDNIRGNSMSDWMSEQTPDNPDWKLKDEWDAFQRWRNKQNRDNH